MQRKKKAKPARKTDVSRLNPCVQPCGQLGEKVVAMRDKLKGKKTYILAALLVANNFAMSYGLLTPEVTEMLNWLFGGGAMASMHAAIARS